MTELTSRVIQAIQTHNATLLRQCLDSSLESLWVEDTLQVLRNFRIDDVIHTKRPSHSHGDIYVHKPTLLLLAVLCGTSEIVEYLASIGEGLDETCVIEDITSSPPEYENVTAVLLASLLGKIVMAKSLVNAGASINKTTSLGDTPLFEACYEGHGSLVQFLVKNGAGINTCNEKGVTCLMIAAYVGNIDIAKLLLNNGANVTATDKRGRNALFYCVSGGHLELLKFFLSYVETRQDFNGMTILMEAALNCHIDILKYLVENSKEICIDVNAKDKNGRNCFFYCCESGKLNTFQVFDYLYRSKATVVPSVEDRTLLMLACLKGSFPVVEFLVKNASRFGININEKDNKGRNCLFYCITGGYLKMLEYLLHEGVRAESSCDGVNIIMQAAGKGKIDLALYIMLHNKELRIDVHQKDKDGWNSLFYCVAGGHTSLCQTLITNGIKVETANDGRTVIMQAAACGHLDLLRYLLDNYYVLGLDVQDKDKDGWNAAFHSVHSDNLEILEFLLKRGARIEPANKDQTLLMEAARKNKTNFVNFLVENARRLQIDPQSCDQDGKNLLCYCASSGNLALFEDFRNLGASIQTDSHGRTVLMQAALGGHFDMCQYLLDNDIVLGLDIFAVDNDGRNAIYYCIESGKLELLLLLIKYRLSMIKDNTGKNNLMRAALLGNLKITQYLVDHSIQHNIDIQASDQNGENVLFYAQRSGNVDVLRILLEAGVQLIASISGANIVQGCIQTERLDLLKVILLYGRDEQLCLLSWDKHYGALLFHQCVVEGDIKILPLLEKYYNPGNDMDENGLTSLMKACQQADSIMVKYLVNIVKVEVNRVDRHEKNALFYATESSNFENIRLLLENGAKPLADDRGHTVAMVAVEKGQIFIADYLLNYSDSRLKLANACDNEGRNLVHFCALGGDCVMLSVLISHGCEVDVADINGTTPLMLAAAKGKTMLASRLIKEGAKPNKIDVKFRSSLHFCCDVENASLTCIGMLIYRGAEVNVRDDLGETPLMKACSRGNALAAKCLLDRGADPILHDYLGRETVELCPRNDHLLRKVLRHYSVMQPHLMWVLEEFRDELIDIVDVTRVLPMMQRDHVITSDLETIILNQASTRGKMSKLLDTLKERGNKAFDVLVKALKKDYKALAYELEMYAYTRDDEIFA